MKMANSFRAVSDRLGTGRDFKAVVSCLLDFAEVVDAELADSCWGVGFASGSTAVCPPAALPR